MFLSIRRSRFRRLMSLLRLPYSLDLVYTVSSLLMLLCMPEASFFSFPLSTLLCCGEGFAAPYFGVSFRWGLYDAMSYAFGHRLYLDWSVLDLWREAMQILFSPQLQSLWRDGIVFVLWVVLLCNHVTFQVHWDVFVETLTLVWRSIRETDSFQTSMMQNSVDELLAMQRFQVNGRPTKVPCILNVIWCPPPPGWLKVNMNWQLFEARVLLIGAGVFRTCKASS